MEESLTYDDVCIVPRNKSDHISRDESATDRNFLGLALSLPILAAPMKSVCKSDMAIKLWNNGCLGVMARTSNATADTDEYAKVKAADCEAVVSMGVTGDYAHRAEMFYELGARIFCLDAANGFNSNINKALVSIRSWFDFTGSDAPLFISGNVGSLEGFKYLSGIGIHAVRVGIGAGSACSTSVATGIGMGQVSLLKEICSYTRQHSESAKVIADGGIKSSGDICKALALGADVVMLGSMLAGTTEAPGELIEQDGKLYKKFFGEASEEAKGSDSYIEGVSTLVPYKGHVEPIISQLGEGIRSSMAYMGCKKLKEFVFPEEKYWQRLSSASRTERNPHILLK